MATISHYSELKLPVPGESPCGKDLQDSEGILGILGSPRILGTQTGIDETAVDWRELRKRVLAYLDRTRDLRLLPYLAAADLRLGGHEPFFALLEVARGWLEAHGDAVHPVPESDFNPRLNAMLDLADGSAILEPLRRAPFLKESSIGPISLRRWFVGHGDLPASADELANASAAELERALADVNAETRSAAQAAIGGALESLSRIEILVAQNPAEPGDLSALRKILSAIQKILNPESAIQPASPMSRTVSTGAVSGLVSSDGTVTAGPIRSRADAIHALTEVQRFFSSTEPSSPVPMLLERAKRLVDRSFLEVLDELLPDAVAEARRVGGIRSDNS